MVDRLRLLVGLPFILATLVTGAIGNSPSAVLALTTPKGWVDQPQGTTVSGSITILGWAIDQGATSGTGVDSVQIVVDGSSRGNATYGGTRPDIEGAYGAQFTLSGFTLPLDTSAFAPGTHSVQARAHSTVSGQISTYAGSFVIAGPTATATPTATSTSPPATSTPTSPPATPTPTVRPATATPTPTLPAATATPTPTNTPAPIRAQPNAFTPTPLPTNTPTPPATPTPPPGPSQPHGWIDAPSDGATVSGTVSFTGWALDAGATTTSGVDRVDFFGDGRSLGSAVYGRDRSDIGAAFGAVRFSPSGFLFVLDSTALGGGTHQIEARAHSTVSGQTTSYARTIFVSGPTATPTLPPTPTPTGTLFTPTPTPTVQVANFTKHFGTNAHLLWYSPRAALLDTARADAAGLQTIRFDVAWQLLEGAGKARYDAAYLARLDSEVQLVSSRKMRPLLVLLGTPGWARGNQGTQGTPPTQPQDYADTLSFLARRYTSIPGIALEVWNEPNQSQTWDTGPDPLAYARMLKAAYTTVKAAAPSVRVVAGAVAFNDQTYLQGLFAFGKIAGQYDAFSLHPYTLGAAPDAGGNGYYSFKGAVEGTAQLMAQYGDANKAIWITEIGWDTSQVAEATRVQYMRSAVAMVRGWPQVEEFEVFEQNQGDGFPGLGLVSDAGNLTLSWPAYSLDVRAPGATSDMRGLIESPTEWADTSADIRVTGWTADLAAASGTGVDTVQVYLDGSFKGNAAYGDPRPDVGAAAESRCGPCGYSYLLSVKGLAAGDHIIEVRVHSSASGMNTSYLRGLSVVSVPTYPAGNLDSPADGSSASGTVRVAGWAVDQAAKTGTGVDGVSVYLDGVLAGNATYGVSRSDIGASYGTQFTGSGYYLDIDLKSIAPGVHAIEVRAHSAVSGSETNYDRKFTVAGP
jgi:hypothetical protein